MEELIPEERERFELIEKAEMLIASFLRTHIKVFKKMLFEDELLPHKTGEALFCGMRLTLSGIFRHSLFQDEVISKLDEGYEKHLDIGLLTQNLLTILIFDHLLEEQEYDAS